VRLKTGELRVQGQPELNSEILPQKKKKRQPFQLELPSSSNSPK
jgi:hypothetical protein